MKTDTDNTRSATTERVPIRPNALVDLDTVLMDSPRLAEIKAHDIQTHHAPHMEDDPWLAIAGVLPQLLIGLPMGCLGYHAFKEINAWMRL